MFMLKAFTFLLLITSCGVVYGEANVRDEGFLSKYQSGRSLTYAGNGVTTHFPTTNAGTDSASGTFKLIGGQAMAKPCCVASAPERVDCFIQAGNGNVHHWWKQGDAYQTEWVNLGGNAVDGIECVSRSTGIIDLLVLWQTYSVYVSTYTSTTGKWTPWVSRGRNFLETPSCAVRTSSIFDCMVRNQYGRGYYTFSNNGRYSNWANRGGWLGYPFVASHRSNTITDFWAIGGLNNIYQIQSNQARYANRKGPVKGKPESVSVNENRIDVLVPSTKNDLMHLPLVNNVPQAWKNLGGPVVDAPSCVVVGTTVQCFFVGGNGYFYRSAYDGSNWTPWANSYGTFIEGPSCTSAKTNQVSCYLRGFDRAIVEMIFTF